MSLKPLNSVGGFSVGDSTITTVIYSNTDVTTNNFVASSTANLGDVGNIYIGGGSSLQVLQTDGAGNLNWISTGTQSEIFNGDSNVQIVSANGNVYINANAGSNYQWVFETTGNTSFPTVGVVSLGNLITANYANFTNNIVVQGNIANANNIIVTNNITSDTANVTGNLITGNANLGNLATANNFSTNGAGGDVTLTGGNVTGANVVIANSFTSNGGTVDFNTNNANVALGSNANVHIYGGAAGEVLQTDGSGNLSWYAISATSIQNGTSNVSIPVANGNVNTSVDGNANVFVVTGIGANVNGNLDASGNLTVQNANLGNLATANYANITTDLVVQGNIANAGNIIVTYNITSDSANVTANLTTGNANLGNLVTANYANFANDVVVLGNIANANNIIATNNITSNTANVTANLTTGNANLGNLITANYANLAYDLQVTGNITTGGGTGGNISGVDYLFANYANFSNDIVVQGNIANANNISVTNNANANNITATNNITSATANVTGNLIVGNIIGIFANGTSNIAIPTANGNINLSANGTANVVIVTDTGANVIGTIQSNGNITTNSVFFGNTLTSTGTYLTIASDQVGNSTYNINLVPGGVGNVDVNSTYITSLANPVNPTDAATKEYVDSVATGLYIHAAANVLSSTNLNATYTSGGTILSVTQIVGNSTVVFSAPHGLSVNDDISFTNSFNGINAAPDVYWVGTVVNSTSITLNETYFGPPVSTLTPGSGLTEPALANSGVGATLTNAGAQAALTVDSVLMTVAARVLITGQTTQSENGIYVVTTVGTGASNWVLTRASDGNTYVPQSSTSLCVGSYWFISQGSLWAGSSWVLTVPSGEIDIGTTNIDFTQFTQAGSYTGANGINITGTVISANTDNVTTTITGGNIVVKTGAQFTTPNIGAATGTSLDLSGNVLAGNLNSNATITTVDLNATGNILAANLTSNAFINAVDGNLTGNLTVGGNITTTGAAGNISGANVIFANSFTSNGGVVDFYTNNANVQLGSNANVHIYGGSAGEVLQTDGSGNLSWYAISATSIQNGTSNVSIPVANGNVNTSVDGNINVFVVTGTGAIVTGSLESSGNLTVQNANLGNLATATYANVSANLTTGNANLGNLATANYANFVNDVIVQGNIANANNISVTNNANANNITATTSITSATANISNNIVLGNTSINWATANTSSITANLTIVKIPVAGITGLEFFVKGVDSGGGKYSAATVQAVTDGSGNVDFVVYGTTFIGALTGTLAVNLVDANANIALQVSASSTNTTVWTTQFRTI